MHPRIQDLALRFQRAIDALEQDRAAADARVARSRAEGRAARQELVAEIAAFARAVGRIAVADHDGGLVLSWGGAALRFVPDGDGDRLRVELGHPTDDAPIAIFRHPEAEFAWVLSVGRPGSEAVEALFDAGLIHLLVEGLGLPAPLPGAPGGGRAQPPLDALVPGDRGA
jgi:hypothetical protein